MRPQNTSLGTLLCVFACFVALPSAAQQGWDARVIQFTAPEQAAPSRSSLDAWDAQIEYGIATDRVDTPKAFADGHDAWTQKTVFATIQRRFNGGDATPYIGIGAGYAEALVDAPSEVADQALAFKGVFGADFVLEENLGAFVEYNFALAPGASSDTGKSLRSHAISTGLRLDLN